MNQNNITMGSGRRTAIHSLIVAAALLHAGHSFAQGDGPRFYWKGLMGTNAFIGPNPLDADGRPFGPRFFDMSAIYDEGLRAIAASKAKRPLKEGVYAALTGPSYETPAEIRMVRAMGGDLVGMSTVPEATAARYLGMRVLGISCVTNMAAGITSAPLDHAEVVEVGKRVESELKALVLDLLSALA